MKLTTPTSAVEISGAVSAPTNFAIATSKEAFKILSSGLYTNKIRAIIRELSCNAYDAHVAAGRADEPFTVHLPTTLEPFFSIKDKGTGLEYIQGGCQPCAGAGHIVVGPVTPESAGIEECKTCGGTGDYDAVKELYCTYFSTNKSQSNLFIGALGLGSKSPFCYTEGFSVSNVYGGMTRVYSCFINEAGLPSVLLQTETATPDAPNGVEIQFPVRQRDIWEFENQAGRVWEFFTPAPIHNVEDLEIEQATYKMRTAAWGLRDDEGGEVRAIQGKVQYSIGEIDESRLDSQMAKLVTLPLDLFFPIGELSVAASREALSNDERTIENILKALESIKTGMIADVKKKIARCSSPWEARLLLFSLSNTEGIGKIIGDAYRDGDFDDANPAFKISPKNLSVNQKDHADVTIHEFSKPRSGRGEAIQQRLTVKVEREKGVITTDPEDMDYVVNFPGDEPALFVINDVGIGVNKYINYLLMGDASNKFGVAYLFTGHFRNTSLEAVFDQATKILQELGNPPVVLLSKLKEKYADVFSRTDGVKGPAAPVRTILLFDEKFYPSAYSKGWTKTWMDVTKEPIPDGPKYYIPLKSLEPTNTYITRTRSVFKNFLSLARAVKALNLAGVPIYGIPEWKVRSLDSSWVELTGYVTKRVKALLTEKRRTQISLYRKRFNSGVNGLLKKVAKDTTLGPDSPLWKYCDAWVKASDYDANELDTYISLVNGFSVMLGVQIDAEPPVDFQALWKSVKEIYPLLGHINDPEAAFDHVIQYARFIDEANQPQLPAAGATFAVVAPAEEETSYVA